MKQQIIFIGGGEARENYRDFFQYLENYEYNPYEEKSERWSHTLGNDLGEDYEVIKVPMPNKHFADYSEWKMMFEKVFPYLKNNFILIGHSLGATFLLKYFDETEFSGTPKKLLLLAAAASDSENEKIGSFNFSTKLKHFDKNFGKKTTLFHSRDDFVVPYTDFLMLKKMLKNPEFQSFTDKNHFLDAEFPELLAYIKNI